MLEAMQPLGTQDEIQGYVKRTEVGAEHIS